MATLAVFLGCAVAVYALRICPSCSYEAAENASFCSHCGARLDGSAGAAAPAAPAAPAVAPAAAPADAPADRLLADGVQAVSEADAALYTAQVSQNPAVALAALRNTLAVLPLAPGAVSPALAAQLQKRETGLLAGLAMESLPCPECHGSGFVDAPEPPRQTLSGGNRGGNTFKSLESSSVREIHETRGTGGRRVCAFCGGNRTLMCVRDRKTLRGALRLAQKDYERLAALEGRVSVQDVFVPAAWQNALPLRSQALLARHAPFAGSCENCAGIGSVPCRTCDGFGRIPCPNKGFHQRARAATGKAGGGDVARIEEVLLDHSGSNSLCPQCNKPADNPGWVACSDCTGKGLAVCRTCDGAGVAEDCRTCRGEGIVSCRNCRGTGKDRRTDAPCQACKGEGLTLCRSCGGNGYGR